MRYWVYINGQVLERPFEKEELASIQGFTGETLICPEVVPAGAAQEWITANVVFPPVQEQPLFAMPQPQALPSYYQYPQQQAYVQPQTVAPYQTTRMPVYAPQPQPVYNPYPAQQTQYNQPVYQQPVQAYNPAEHTQNFDAQDMFDTAPSEDTISSPIYSATEAELLQKIDALTKEVEEVKQKLYSLSDTFHYSPSAAPQAEPAEYEQEEAPASQTQEQAQASAPAQESVALPAGYIDDIPEVVQDEDTQSSANSVLSESHTDESADSSDAIKDMDSLLGGVAAVSPSEDFLQDAINTTFSNKHKKEAVTDPNAIVDLAKKENTESKMSHPVGTVVTDGNDLSEDEVPTVEEDFEDKLSFTQANIETLKHSDEEEEDEFAQHQAPLPEDLSHHTMPAGENAGGEVREITEELLSEPASSQSLAEEGEFVQEEPAPVQEEFSAEPQPFEIDASSADKDDTKTATLEEVFNEQPLQPEQEEEAPAQEESVEELAPEQQELPSEDQQELPQEEEPLPSDISQEDADGIPQEVPSAQNIGETEDDASFRAQQDNLTENQEETAVAEEAEAAPQEQQEELAAEPVLENQEEEPLAEQLPQEDADLPPADGLEDDPMNIETSQSEHENEVLQEFAEDKKHLDENTKDMTSSAFNVVASGEGQSSLDELTANAQPALGPMPAEGEDQFLKTFTSSIEEVFLDQPTSIISDYVPPAQASASAEDFETMDVISGGATPAQGDNNVNLMDLKSAPQDDSDALKKVRRIKPAAIKTIPMVAANGGDLTQTQGQPDIEEAIAELGGNSILEKSLKMFGTISGLLVILLLFIALLAVMHIIPVRLSPAHYLLSKVFKKADAEATVGNNAVDASVAEALKEKEAKLAAAQEIITKVKAYKLADGSALEQKILSLHAKDAALIEWTADQAVDPSYYSIAAKLPPNQEGYSLTYRFSYNTMDNSLVPTTSEANNIIQAAALSAMPQTPQQVGQMAPINQMPQVRRPQPPGTGIR